LFILLVTLVGLVIVLLLLSVFVLPAAIVKAPSGHQNLEGADRVTAENALSTLRNGVRTTLVQAVAGALFFVTAWVAWLQIRTARQGQLTDRFTKSIDQLGNDKIEVRLGGIFALRQMARHKDFRSPVARVLAAYLQTQSHDQIAEAQTDGHERTNTDASPEPSAKVESTPPLSESNPPLSVDLQAVLRILIGEDDLWRRSEGQARLDLSFVRLPGANLAGADLTGTYLFNAQFRAADMRGTILRGADLREANVNGALLMAHSHLEDALLEKASFVSSDLTGAYLYRCSAKGANFANAILINADLTGADLTESDLRGANLSGAECDGLNLEGADLAGAILMHLKNSERITFDAHTSVAGALMDPVTRRHFLGGQPEDGDDKEGRSTKS
jgi:hypothetical protein